MYYYRLSPFDACLYVIKRLHHSKIHIEQTQLAKSPRRDVFGWTEIGQSNDSRLWVEWERERVMRKTARNPFIVFSSFLYFRLVAYIPSRATKQLIECKQAINMLIDFIRGQSYIFEATQVYSHMILCEGWAKSRETMNTFHASKIAKKWLQSTRTTTNRSRGSKNKASKAIKRHKE